MSWLEDVVSKGSALDVNVYILSRSSQHSNGPRHHKMFNMNGVLSFTLLKQPSYTISATMVCSNAIDGLKSPLFAHSSRLCHSCFKHARTLKMLAQNAPKPRIELGPRRKQRWKQIDHVKDLASKFPLTTLAMETLQGV